MPTIRDVAKRANVAPITVSRVINNSGYVSEETRQRVEAAVAELNYIPNRLGPSLRSSRTNTIALVVTDITNPFWTTVARGAEDAAQSADYHLILCNSDESWDKQHKYLELLLSRQVDGFLFVPATYDAAPIEMIQGQGVSVVVLDRIVPTRSVDTVRTDSIAGSYTLTKHLIELGHQNIAIITGPKEVSTARDRATGYEKAMSEENLPAQIYWGQFTQDVSYELTMQAIHKPNRPTALVAGNNFIAIGAMRAITDSNLTVPDDISLVAFDELPDALIMLPFLTVVAQPAYDMGFQAARLLLKRMQNDEQPFQEIVLPCNFIVRRSSQSPK